MLYIVYDPRYGSLVRPEGQRTRPADPRWEKPRFLERLDIEKVLIPVPKTPPTDAKVVWFALPDPQPMNIVKHYDHWQRNSKSSLVINHPFLTFRTKELWFYFLNQHGIRAPMPNPNSIFKKTQFHGYGPEFGVEFIDSRGQNPNPDTSVPNSSKWHKVWRTVSFNGKCGDQCARLEGPQFWVGTGCADHAREMRSTPLEYRKITEKVAEISGLKYFQLEIIPSPWVGPVVCDVNPHPFDVMEGRLNDCIQVYVEETICNL